MKVVTVLEIVEKSKDVEGVKKPIINSENYIYDKKDFSKNVVYNYFDSLYNLKHYDFISGVNEFKMNYDINDLKGNFTLINKFRCFEVSFKFTKALEIEGEYFRLDKIEISK